jgi:hypothetical protein
MRSHNTFHIKGFIKKSIKIYLAGNNLIFIFLCLKSLNYHTHNFLNIKKKIKNKEKFLLNYFSVKFKSL